MEARSWNEIEDHYIELNNHGWNHEKLLELVRYIQTTELSNKLYATTSLDKLIISNNSQIEFEKDALHIEFDKLKQKWSFKYYGGSTYNVNQPEFHRIYEGSSGIEKLCNFVKLINW